MNQKLEQALMDIQRDIHSVPNKLKRGQCQAPSARASKAASTRKLNQLLRDRQCVNLKFANTINAAVAAGAVFTILAYAGDIMTVRFAFCKGEAAEIYAQTEVIGATHFQITTSLSPDQVEALEAQVQAWVEGLAKSSAVTQTVTWRAPWTKAEGVQS